MKTSGWVLILLVGCASCGQHKAVSDGAGAGTQPSNAPTNEISSGEVPNAAKSNAPSGMPQLSDRGNASASPKSTSASEPQPWSYVTNGNITLKIFATTNGGRIISSKAVDETGTLKWTDSYSYDNAGDSGKLIASRRTKPDGTMIQVYYQYSSDGKQRKIVIGPDGNRVPPAEEDAVLNR